MSQLSIGQILANPVLHCDAYTSPKSFSPKGIEARHTLRPTNPWLLLPFAPRDGKRAALFASRSSVRTVPRRPFAEHDPLLAIPACWTVSRRRFCIGPCVHTNARKGISCLRPSYFRTGISEKAIAPVSAFFVLCFCGCMCVHTNTRKDAAFQYPAFPSPIFSHTDVFATMLCFLCQRFGRECLPYHLLRQQHFRSDVFSAAFPVPAFSAPAFFRIGALEVCLSAPAFPCRHFRSAAQPRARP